MRGPQADDEGESVRGALARQGHFGPLATSGLIAFCTVLLLGLVLMARIMPVIAVGFAIFLVLFVVLGFERLGTILMIASLFLAPMNNVRLVAGGAGITASDIVFFVAVVLLIPLLLGKPLRFPTFYFPGAAGLVILGVLASMVSDEPLLSVLLMSKLLIAAIFMPVLFMWWRPGLNLIMVMAAAYVCGNMVSVGYALVDPVQAYRSYGLTTHVNNFGHASLLSIALLPFIWRQLPQRLRWTTWVAGLVCTWGIWSSGSRAALLVLVLIMLLYPIVERSGKVFFAGAVVGTLSLLFLSQIRGADERSALGRLFGGSASANSDRERSNALKLGWEQFNERPLTGRGFVDVIDFHNVILAVAVAVGVVGVAFYLTLLWSTIQPIFFGPRPYGLIAYPALAYLLFGALSTNLWDRFVWVILALILATRVLADEAAENPDEAEAPESSPAPVVISPRRSP